MLQFLEHFFEAMAAEFGSQDPTLFYVHVALIVYFVTGLPVVFLYVRQQKMMQPIRSLGVGNTQRMVVYTLTVVWPCLLLGMVLTYLQRPKDSRGDE